jgi:uncharacterized membrane-anchored protein
MSQQQLNQLVSDATTASILPASATPPAQEERPWPVVLLTALGAWLAAIPLILMLGVLLGSLLEKGIAPYIVGPALLIGTAFVLRAGGVALFVEQLAVAALLVGGVLLGYGLFRDLPAELAAALMAVCAGALAWAIPRTWLRVLLGAAMCSFTLFAISMLTFIPYERTFNETRLFFWIALHLCLAGWAATQYVLDQGKGGARAELLETLSSGWVLVLIAGLAGYSGMTFLVGASVDFGGAGARETDHGGPLSVVSLVLAGSAAAWLKYRWPGMRQGWLAGVATVVILLAWLMPSLGAVLLIISLCAASKRWRLACVAAVAAAWIIGSFYYQLHFPLATKAMMLAGAGALLGALAWFALRGQIAHTPGSTPVATSRASQLGITLSLFAVLAVANIGIWQKEDLIAHGRPVFVELAPVDPRSLMQGDYMQLNFNLPPTDWRETRFLRSGRRPHVVVSLDAKGIASIKRLDDDKPLAKDEMLIQLTSTKQGWTLVSDAWYFKEGEAQRWSRAKYGEFRVNGDGRALLVGMRGPALEAL